MTAWAYYNEFNPYAAQWIRNLIQMGLLAPGDVDERDLRTVQPDDLRGFTQVHFCAGIGVWSYALRRAGWPDERPVWTGSFPCQSFSDAGLQLGFDDPRHLWPVGYRLIDAHRPPVFFGEQVASSLVIGKSGKRRVDSSHGGDREAQKPTAWIDLVLSDMERSHYALGVQVSPAAGYGAPHIRQRTYFAAQRLEDAERPRLEGFARHGDRGRGGPEQAGSVAEGGEPRWLVDSDGRNAGPERQQRSRQQRQFEKDGRAAERVADSSEWRRQARCRPPTEESRQPEFGLGDFDANGRLADPGRRPLPEQIWRAQGRNGHGPDRENDQRSARRPGPVDGFWRDPDWLFCRDGRWRPVESGTFPLVDGSAFRVGSGGAFEGKSRQEILRGYGNAIVEEHARIFIETYLEATGGIIDADDGLPARPESLLKSERESDIEDLA